MHVVLLLIQPSVSQNMWLVFLIVGFSFYIKRVLFKVSHTCFIDIVRMMFVVFSWLGRVAG